jgi:hypothetical protein
VPRLRRWSANRQAQRLNNSTNKRQIDKDKWETGGHGD